MAQEVKLMGATYSDVPAVMLPDSNDTLHRFDDASVTTATASDVASGKVFLASDGTITTGTASGGGTSSWTKVAETTYNVSTTSTTATVVATWETGASSIWTNDKFVYVRIRDTEGSRTGYFYGSDNFFLKSQYITASSYTTAIRFTKYRNTNGNTQAVAQSSTTGYGVFADTIYSDGRIRIRQRYNSSYGTINSTYIVEVYLLDPADGVLPFE